MNFGTSLLGGLPWPYRGRFNVNDQSFGIWDLEDRRLIGTVEYHESLIRSPRELTDKIGAILHGWEWDGLRIMQIAQVGP